MTYRDNTAYDFELFTQPKSRVVELPDHSRNSRSNIKRVNNKRVASSTRPRAKIITVSAVVLLLMLVIAQLFCQLKSSEIVDQINTANKEIRVLQSEHTRLQVELDGKTSFTNMEAAAKEMGMQKMTVAQNHYIKLCTEDAVEVSKENEGIPAKVGEMLR